MKNAQKKQHKMQWLQIQSEISGDNLNNDILGIKRQNQ
jgi:hypothetical protein